MVLIRFLCCFLLNFVIFYYYFVVHFFFWVHLCMHRIDLGFGGGTQKHGVWYMWVQFYSYYHRETYQSFKHEDLCIWDSISSHHYVHICIYFLLLLFRIAIIFFFYICLSLCRQRTGKFILLVEIIWEIIGSSKAQIVNCFTYTKANRMLYIHMKYYAGDKHSKFLRHWRKFWSMKNQIEKLCDN